MEENQHRATLGLPCPPSCRKFPGGLVNNGEELECHCGLIQSTHLKGLGNAGAFSSRLHCLYPKETCFSDGVSGRSTGQWSAFGAGRVPQSLSAHSDSVSTASAPRPLVPAQSPACMSSHGKTDPRGSSVPTPKLARRRHSCQGQKVLTRHCV